jgi:hypothetical protein
VHLLNIPHDVRIDAVPLRGQQVAPHIGKQQRAQDLEVVDRARKSGAAPSTVVPIAPQRWAAVSQTAATSGSTRRRMRSALKPIRRGGRPWRITTWKPPAGTVRHRTADPGAEIFCQIMVICYHALALGFFRRVSGYLGGI